MTELATKGFADTVRPVRRLTSDLTLVKGLIHVTISSLSNTVFSAWKELSGPVETGSLKGLGVWILLARIRAFRGARSSNGRRRSFPLLESNGVANGFCRAGDTILLADDGGGAVEDLWICDPSNQDSESVIGLATLAIARPDFTLDHVSKEDCVCGLLCRKEGRMTFFPNWSNSGRVEVFDSVADCLKVDLAGLSSDFKGRVSALEFSNFVGDFDGLTRRDLSALGRK